MFTKAILTAFAVTFAATGAHAFESERHENARPANELQRNAVQTVEVPAYKVMSDKDRARANLARLDLVSVSVLGNGTGPIDRSSRNDYQ